MVQTTQEAKERTGTATDILLTEYISICNRAIASHRDSFPFRQLLEVAEKLAGDKTFAVAIYADNPKRPHDYFTIELLDGLFVVVAHGKKDPDITWRVRQSYLEQVVSDPQTYIENPAKLDWDWLKSRVGVA